MCWHTVVNNLLNLTGVIAVNKCFFLISLVFLSACATSDLVGQMDAHPNVSKRGWNDLFNGQDLTGFMVSAEKKLDGLKESPGKGGKPCWVVEDGCLVRKGKGGYIWTQKRYGNFILDFEVNTKGNSGLFFRTDNIKNCVQTGMEMQVLPNGGPGQNKAFGAIYDCLAPSEKVGGPGWNHVTLACLDNKISVVIDDKHVIDMDLDQWTEPRKNPDGSKNKFKTALKDFKREGHIGFQEHGAEVRYRNIKIKELK